MKNHTAPPNEKSAAQPQPVTEKKNLPKTSGERWYDVISFAVGKVSIIAATAGIAFVAAYGKDKYGPVPNYLKKLMTSIDKMRAPWAEEAEKLATAYKSGQPGVTRWQSTKADFKAIFGGSLAGAVILWWGGAAFAPIMKLMENSKEKISNVMNKRFGTPEEVAIAHERLKDDPKQTWGDVVKGRIAAFCFAFTAFSSACFAFGRVKTPTDKGRYLLRFDWYEEKVGRLIAGLTKAGKEIAATPMSKELSAAQKENSHYRLGKIIAIDFYATSLAIVVWNYFSRKSARKRQEAKNMLAEATAAIAEPDAVHFSSEYTQKPHATGFSRAENHAEAVLESKEMNLQPAR